VDQHAVHDRGQMIGRDATPGGKGGSVQVDTTPPMDLALAIQGQVIGLFGHRHMGERAFGQKTAFDQPVCCRGLADACIAAAAGVFGVDRNNNLEPGRNDIQPFGTIFTDPDHVGATTRAYLVLRLDQHQLPLPRKTTLLRKVPRY
jgi:hypothetical protein